MHMKKLLLFIVLVAFPLLALAQASGGQISRKKPKTTGNSKVGYKHKVAKPEAVDLGLPSGTLWADRNVGADSPTAYGGLYRYGAPKTRMDGSNSEVSNLHMITGTANDVAMTNLGSNWRTPSREQAEELITNCRITNEVINRIKVKKFIGPNGNYIIFPLAGTMYNYGRSQAGDFGLYMLGNKFFDFSIDYDKVHVWNLNYETEWGLSVRAVFYPNE